MAVERHGNKTTRGESCLEYSLPLEVSSDSTHYLVHPNGSSCQADSRFFEYYQDALAYAEEAQYRKEYIEAAEKSGQTPLEVAAIDFFRPPEILCINAEQYNGREGNLIYVTAFDTVKVERIGILVLSDQGRLLEMGHAGLVKGDVWCYRAKRTLQVASVLIIADAVDLPGHMVEKRITKILKRGRNRSRKKFNAEKFWRR